MTNKECGMSEVGERRSREGFRKRQAITLEETVVRSGPALILTKDQVHMCWREYQLRNLSSRRCRSCRVDVEINRWTNTRMDGWMDG